VSEIQPCPLQEFWPAQEWSTPPHSPVPLHEFTPEHSPFAGAVDAVFAEAGPFFAQPAAIASAASAAAAKAVFLSMEILLSIVVGSERPRAPGDDTSSNNFLKRSSRASPASQERPAALGGGPFFILRKRGSCAGGYLLL
jgi:hypothetical protein